MKIFRNFKVFRKSSEIFGSVRTLSENLLMWWASFGNICRSWKFWQAFNATSCQHNSCTSVMAWKQSGIPLVAYRPLHTAKYATVMTGWDGMKYNTIQYNTTQYAIQLFLLAVFCRKVYRKEGGLEYVVQAPIVWQLESFNQLGMFTNKTVMLSRPNPKGCNSVNVIKWSCPWLSLLKFGRLQNDVERRANAYIWMRLGLPPTLIRWKRSGK